MFFSCMRKSSLKIYGTLIASLALSIQGSADNIAIIGGIDLAGSGPAYAALVSNSGELIPLTLTGDALAGGIINSVSMNSSGNGLIGGQGQTGAAYAALVSNSGEISPLLFTGGLEIHGAINSAQINSSGIGIIGGRETIGPIYAALVPAAGNPLQVLTFPPLIASGGIINSVAINDLGNGLIGGQAFFGLQSAYAASVSPLGGIRSLTLTGGIATNGTISSVSINSSGMALSEGKI